MEPTGSLPHSQEPAMSPYPEPVDPVHAPLPLLYDPCYYYPPIYAWVFQVVSFPQVSPPKSCTHPSYLPYVLHALTISVFLIWSLE